jgi:ribose transport system permease protein
VISSLITTMSMPEYARQIVYGLILLALLSVYGRQRALRQ